jgi:hypothetical protein
MTVFTNPAVGIPSPLCRQGRGSSSRGGHLSSRGRDRFKSADDPLYDISKPFHALDTDMERFRERGKGNTRAKNVFHG